MIKTKNTDTDFHCVLTNDVLNLDSDAPLFKGGIGNGFRPHELLEAALASCISIIIRMIAKEKNIKLDRVETQVEVDRTQSDKSIFNYRISLDDALNANDREFFMNIIDFCAIKQTLSKQLEFVQYE
jgi:putative redox protein